MATPRIQLKNVNGFPNEFHESGKILTANFIDASREIVFIFDKFGKLFTPVVKDMRGNVESLDAHYQKDVANRKFIEDMLLSEDGAVTRSWLLWLNRSLEMIERFFWFMLNNEEIISEKCDNVNHCVRQAYDVTLKPYHGFLLQSGFKVSISCTSNIGCVIIFLALSSSWFAICLQDHLCLEAAPNSLTTLMKSKCCSQI